jgi:hypothetical protein
MRTTTSRAIASTPFAGMYDCSILIMCMLLFFLVVIYVKFHNYMFCFSQCTEEAHRPVNCETVSKWILKNSAESENMNWFVAGSSLCYSFDVFFPVLFFLSLMA